MIFPIVIEGNGEIGQQPQQTKMLEGMLETRGQTYFLKALGETPNSSLKLRLNQAGSLRPHW